MTLTIASILFFVGICRWMHHEEKSTHLEINELISLIDRLEQEKQLHLSNHAIRPISSGQSASA